ncbi:DUF3375 family protein, partial [Enterobacter hormaechei]|uniref:DUF3375 family protein n=1 Tax=Enterobacter hormaechei TaxID=158836 RepID=UPI00195494B6
LNDAEQSAQLDAALEAVLARGFARRLDRNERNFLRSFTSTMLERRRLVVSCRSRPMPRCAGNSSRRASA